MAMSDKIEAFILELLKEDDDWLEIGRNELASVFNCVPSQINYVISTRFCPERGYAVESRRGGGGCLRIKRLDGAGGSLLKDTVNQIGNSVDSKKAESLIQRLIVQNEIDSRSGALIAAAISDKSLPQSLGAKRDEIRANIAKNMLAALM